MTIKTPIATTIATEMVRKIVTLPNNEIPDNKTVFNKKFGIATIICLISPTNGPIGPNNARDAKLTKVEPLMSLNAVNTCTIAVAMYNAPFDLLFCSFVIFLLKKIIIVSKIKNNIEKNNC